MRSAGNVFALADSSAERMTASRITSTESSGFLLCAFSSIMRARSSGSDSPVHADAHRLVIAQRALDQGRELLVALRALPTLPGLMRYFASARAQSGYCVRSLWPL